MDLALEHAQLTVQQRSAFYLADLGFWVFPIIPGEKSPPVMTEWQAAATRDYQTIMNWWSLNPNYNIGISTSKYRDDEALVVVDVDTKRDGQGNTEIIRLELAGYTFPDTFTQRTPTGGRHLVYSCPRPLRQGTSVLGKNLDVRSGGGYIVGAGSSRTQGTYTGNICPVLPAPDWIIQACTQRTEARTIEGVFTVDASAARSRAEAYLQNSAPAAMQGQGGDETTYKVAAVCKDYGVTEPECFALMLACWNDRCQPPWSYDELSTKVAHAYKYGANTPGVSAPEAAFQPVGAPIPSVDDLSPIQKINLTYAYVIAGGGQHVLWETLDEQGSPRLEHLSIETFHGKFAPHKLLFDGKSTALSKVWLNSFQRREYDGLVFNPEQPTGPRFYNLWKGFRYRPAESAAHPAVEQFCEHAFNNVCNRDTELFNWLMGYFAQLIQRPWEKPLVALVFKGAKGVGKNALLERIGALLGGHFLLTSNRRYLIGNFNGHLERLLLFVLDEAFWSGDKQAEGVLKDLITGREHVIEHKGQEPYAVANRTRIAIIGNEDWLVPATYDERRFAVFNVGEGRKQDRKFFTSMREGMEEGGYANLLRYFMDYSITSDPNHAPDTEGLREQKHYSLDAMQQWWLDCLTEEQILGLDYPGWPNEMECEALRGAFRRYVKQRNITKWVVDDRSFGKALVKFAPSCRRQRATQVVGGVRRYVYPMYSVEHYRGEWEAFINHKVEW